MNMKKRLGTLFFAVAAAFSMTACGGNKPAEPASGESASQAVTQDSGAEELDAYIRENLPPEYPASDQFLCEVITSESGYHVNLTLPIDSDGMSDEEIKKMLQMETGYLMDGKLADAPEKASYTLNFLLTGGESAITEKHDGLQYELIYKGDSIYFSFAED